MTDELAELPTAYLVEPWVLLRPVRTGSVEYAEMRDSIEAVGFLAPIAVRPSKRCSGQWEVIDGMWRLTCAKDLCLPTVPAIIKRDITDADVLALQIQANAVRPTTKPCEFARQLQRIQNATPGMTLSQLSVAVKKHPGWIRKQLGLLALERNIQAAIDRGEICLQNAHMLAKVPRRFRQEYVDRAKTMLAKEYDALIASVVKAYKEAVRQGKLDAFFTEDFQPQAYLRSLREIEDEYAKTVEGPLTVAAADCKTPIDGWKAALQWALHLDRNSVAKQEAAARDRVRQKWRR